MSLGKLRQVKSDRAFRRFDLIVYGIVLLFVVILFILVFTLTDSSHLKGVRVFVDGKAIFSYTFENDEYETSGEGVEVENSQSKLVITVSAGGGYNKIVIDKRARKARVFEADCRAKTCTYMHLNDNSDVIHCAQHKLRVEPLDYSPDGGYIPLG